MSLLDLFSSPPAAAPEVPAPTQAQETIPTQAPETPAPAPTPEIPPAPLDSFADLWETPDEVIQQEQEAAQGFNIDPTKLAAAAKDINFAQVITPELTEKIKSGGDDAMVSMIQAMNMMSQQVFAQSAVAATKISEAAYNKAKSGLSDEINTHIQKSTVQSSLAKENPALNHKAAAPIITALQQQIARKFPNSTAEQQLEHAQKYLKDFSEVLQPAQPEVPDLNSTNWEEFLD